MLYSSIKDEVTNIKEILKYKYCSINVVGSDLPDAVNFFQQRYIFNTKIRTLFNDNTYIKGSYGVTINNGIITLAGSLFDKGWLYINQIYGFN